MRERMGLAPGGALLVSLVALLVLAACGGTSTSTTTSGAGTARATAATAATAATVGTTSGAATASPAARTTASPASAASSGVASPTIATASPAASGGAVNKNIKLTIGSKLDIDGQLNGEMYALLLQDKGYNVTTKLGLGQTPVLDQAIKSGAIDIYPEFTGTALTLLNLPATQDAQQAYQAVKQAYEQKFQITWLEPAYKLNDSYAVCTSQEMAKKYNLQSLDDLKSVADKLNIAAPQDGIDAAINPVQNGYGIKFGKVTQINYPLSFDAVKKGDADLNVCYTTDPAIVVNNFVVLKDPKNVFPIYNPAPIVRDQVLQQAPEIAATLNALQPRLTTEVIVNLIKQVSIDHKSVEEVARAFLQQEGLLKK